MPVTVFADVFLPNAIIQAGVRGRQIRKNSRVTTDSGAESVNIVWTQTLREFDIGIAPMAREAWQAVETLHEITHGGAYGFLMQDPKDFTVVGLQGVLSLVSGTTYQLWKQSVHSPSLRFNNRKITRPSANGFIISNAGVPLNPANYTLNVADGTIDIPAGGAAAGFSWTGSFYVPVHFMNDTIDWDMVISGQNPDSRFLAGPSVVLQEIRE